MRSKLPAVAKRLGDDGKIKYFAQELKANTYNLTRMNLVMRGISPYNIVARNGDTLEDDWPYFDEGDPAGSYEPLYVDAVVSNPPYSQAWDPSDKENDKRFKYGVAPKSKADYAFLLHDLYHLRAGGIMTIVLPHGVLFRGGEEGTIRRNLIEHDHIHAIIGLPANIFFGTGIPTIVMALRQKRVENDVLIVDASRGFAKEGKNNVLRACDIKRIVDVVIARETAGELFSRIEDQALIDKYAAYQILDDRWGLVAADLEILQTEGMEAAKAVDPHMVLKRKNGIDVEVQEGWIGRIFPFGLVQERYLSAEAKALAETERRLTDISGSYDELLDSLTEEERGSSFVNDAGDAFVLKEAAAALADALDDAGVVAKSAKQRISVGMKQPEDALVLSWPHSYPWSMRRRRSRSRSRKSARRWND